jgi:hypothetical protein
MGLLTMGAAVLLFFLIQSECGTLRATRSFVGSRARCRGPGGNRELDATRLVLARRGARDMRPMGWIARPFRRPAASDIAFHAVAGPRAGCRCGPRRPHLVGEHPLVARVGRVRGRCAPCKWPAERSPLMRISKRPPDWCRGSPYRPRRPPARRSGLPRANRIPPGASAYSTRQKPLSPRPDAMP